MVFGHSIELWRSNTGVMAMAWDRRNLPLFFFGGGGVGSRRNCNKITKASLLAIADATSEKVFQDELEGVFSFSCGLSSPFFHITSYFTLSTPLGAQ